jgi:hypothetical protein
MLPPPASAVATGVRLSPPKAAAADGGPSGGGNGKSVTHTMGGVALEFEYTSKDVLGEGREVAEVVTVRRAPGPAAGMGAGAGAIQRPLPPSPPLDLASKAAVMLQGQVPI